MDKKDMSSVCMFKNKRFPYEHLWVAYIDGQITEEEFDLCYKTNCDKCIWMSEVCMYGEV